MDARAYVSVHDSGLLGQPPIILPIPLGLHIEQILVRSGDLLIAQLASAALCGEQRVPLSYNERYKLYDRLDCIGPSFSVTGA
jgi:hypothetical protein